MIIRSALDSWMLKKGMNSWLLFACSCFPRAGAYGGYTCTLLCEKCNGQMDLSMDYFHVQSCIDRGKEKLSLIGELALTILHH